MFKEDDDDDVDEDVGQSRYPVMPSLVAMQQMKNRLHLAYLGKKLMKWTAMATNKELRRLGLVMNKRYDNFRDQVCQAFLLLARSRYFCPKMNIVVLENVGNNASMGVDCEKRSITGVKVIDWIIVDTGVDPYAHLGIGSGGSAINEAKLAWKELLKLMILMLQEKTTFKFLDEANRNANKRHNVLGKVVVPRITNTIKYIAQELEEKEREEFFRLTRIKDIKNRMASTAKDEAKAKVEEIPEEEAIPEKTGPCPSCRNNVNSLENTKKRKEWEGNLQNLKKEIHSVIAATKDAKNKGLKAKDTEEFMKEANDLIRLLDKTLSTPDPIPVKESCTCKSAPPPPPPPPVSKSKSPSGCTCHTDKLKPTKQPLPPAPTSCPTCQSNTDKSSKASIKSGAQSPCSSTSRRQDLELGTPKPRTKPAQAPCAVCVTEPKPVPPPAPITSAVQSPCPATCRQHDLELGRPKPQSPPPPVPKPAAQSPCPVCQPQISQKKPKPPAKSPAASCKSSKSAGPPCASICHLPQPQPVPKPTAPAPCPVCQPQKVKPVTPKPQPPKLKTPEKSTGRHSQSQPVPKPTAPTPCPVCQPQKVKPVTSKSQPPKLKTPEKSTGRHSQPQPVPKPTAPAPCSVCQPQKVKPVTPKPQPPKLKTPEKSPARSPTPSNKSLSTQCTCHYSQPQPTPPATCPVCQPQMVAPKLQSPSEPKLPAKSPAVSFKSLSAKSPCASICRPSQPQPVPKPTAPAPCPVCQPQKVKPVTPKPQPPKLKTPEKSPARSPTPSNKSLSEQLPCAPTCPYSQLQPKPKPTAPAPCPVCQPQMVAPKLQPKPKLPTKSPTVSDKSLSERSSCASTCRHPQPQPVPKPTAPAPCPVCQPQKVKPVTPKPQPPKLKTPEKSPARSSTPSHKSLSTQCPCSQPQPTPPPCPVCQPHKVKQITPKPQPTKLKSPEKSPARSPMASYTSLRAEFPCASICHYTPEPRPEPEPTLTPCPICKQTCCQPGEPSPQPSYVQELYNKFKNIGESPITSSTSSRSTSTYRSWTPKTGANESSDVRTIYAVSPKPSPKALLSPRSRSQSVGSSLQTSDSDLGTFETYTNKTTKILRTIGNDGVISEAKKVTKVTKTIRTRQPRVLNDPSEQSNSTICNRSNQSSGCSTPTYSCYEPKCCEMLTFKSPLPHHNIPKTYSEIITRSPSLADPNIRSCISFSSVYIFDDRSTDDLCLDILEEKNTRQEYKNLNYPNGRLHNFTNSEDELITRVDQRRFEVIPKSKSLCTTHDTKKIIKDAEKSRSFNVVY